MGVVFLRAISGGIYNIFSKRIIMAIRRIV